MAVLKRSDLYVPQADPVDPEAEEKARREARRLLRLKILFPILLVCVFLAYAFTSNFIPSESMLPTLRPGDHVITMRAWLAYPGGRMPARFDIITFKLPPERLREVLEATGQGYDDSEEGAIKSGRRRIGIFRNEDSDILIKRVIGLPGETVQLIGSDVLINGKKLNRPYEAIDFAVPVTDFPFAGEQPITLGPDELFVLGDNAMTSDDSRYWGPLKREMVLGRYVRILFREGEAGPNSRAAEEQRQRHAAAE